jgi:Glycosyl hydrolase family 63 C-terminal domain
MSAESDRLRDPTADWSRWGPYLSDRAWGTVREDYSANGNAWAYFPFDHAHQRAYRWGEDGLGGFSDRDQRLCLGLALWNGHDPILKERLFGLANEEGNHGEDVKEEYFYLDATPTHSYLRMLYRYPRTAFPYQQLRAENRRRSRSQPEFELRDTGIFDGNRFFEIEIEYAKAGPDDVLWIITARNRGPEPAELHLIPQAWFRNTWAWSAMSGEKPTFTGIDDTTIEARHTDLGAFILAADGQPTAIFCDNETNLDRVFGVHNTTEYPKDAFHDRIVRGAANATNPERVGTKVGFWYHLTLPPGGSATVRVRLAAADAPTPTEDFDVTLDRRRAEADEFYGELQASNVSAEVRAVQRQAWAGLIWSKQFYNYDVETWLKGDDGEPSPPPEHQQVRNFDWDHLKAADIVSMPDKWEYPWFAAWDLALQAVAFARIDPQFAKQQILLLTRDEYQHPNGQLPGYEWTFNDSNPPLHGWAAWAVYQADRKANGEGDRVFLERVFHKLMLDFAWWVNRKDVTGRNVFQGGFLGLDNVGVFNRSEPLPTGAMLNQADGTAWVACYALSLMRIALELAIGDPLFQELAAKFFDHFLYIARAMTNLGGTGVGMWDETDEFYYDELVEPGGRMVPLRVRSMVGLVPLLAVEVLGPETLIRAPIFRARLERTLVGRKDLAAIVSRWHDPGKGEQRLLSLLRGHRMKCLLRRMLDPNEFLSDFGIRSMSKAHLDNPFVLDAFGQRLTVAYVPGESDSGMFGGNSNWRGPVWMPMNYLLIAALRKFHRYYGDDFRVECPTGSGNKLSLDEVANEISRRIGSLFLVNNQGTRPGPGGGLSEPLLFHEYFDGDTGRGLGASHQTGWTALVAELMFGGA